MEDDLSMQKLLKLRLQSCGYRVVSALHGREGLDRLKEEPVDLIISDIMMPVMDGFEFYDAIKKDAHSRRIPVIILTAKQILRDTFLVLGADCFIAKPFKTEELLSKIAELLTVPTPSKTTALSREKQETLEDIPLKNLTPPRILVTGTLIPIVDFMVEELIKIGCLTDVALNVDQVIEKSLAFRPSLILLEAQLHTESAYHIIRKLKTAVYLQPRFLLYAYFLENAKLKNSIVSRLFYSHLKDLSKEERQYIQYLGFFKKDTFVKRMRKFLTPAASENG